MPTPREREMRSLLAQLDNSALSTRDFADLHGVSVMTIYWWRSELRRRDRERGHDFAHTCRAGRGRRTWLRGLVNVTKRYVIHAVAHNLGRIMRALFGVGTPRRLQSPSKALERAYLAAICLLTAICAMLAKYGADMRSTFRKCMRDIRDAANPHRRVGITLCSTRC
ncbi:MAG: hypothetical protein KDC95_06155 [Planctomycetes bacterium]|nr:hypothetical protein [Planctomycetota bacterium]